MKRISVSVVFLFAAWFGAVIGLAEPVSSFVIEDGTRDPKQFYDEKPDFIEKTWDLASEGDTSVHFRINPQSNRGLITKYNWPEAQDFSDIARDGMVAFDLYVVDPAKIRNDATGARLEFTLGSRSNEKFCGWMIGAGLLKPNSWNHIVLRVTNGVPALAGSHVNGVSFSSDPNSHVHGGEVNWTRVDYLRIQIPSTGGVEGYLDNCLAKTFAETVPKKEVTFLRNEQTTPEGYPTDEIIPPDVRKDAFFEHPDIDFSTIQGWKATFYDADGQFYLSSKQAIRGVPNARIEARCTGPNGRIVLTPSRSVKIAHEFDTVEAWVNGRDHQGRKLAVNFRKPDGTVFSISGGDSKWSHGGLIFVNWMLYRNRDAAGVAPQGTELVSIEIGPLAAGAKYLFTLDSMRFTKFNLGTPAPVFKNVGAPIEIPVSPDGSCPVTKKEIAARLYRDGGRFIFEYKQEAETVRYILSPTTGTLSDISVERVGHGTFRPAASSGPVLVFDGETFNATGDTRVKPQLLSPTVENDRVKLAWKYNTPKGATQIDYEFFLMGKTLAVEAQSNEARVAEWLFGHADGCASPKIVETPYMRYHPNILLDRGLFVSYLSDWYFSNASTVPYVGDNSIEGDEAFYSYTRNSQYGYLTRTDGSRHPFKERFYIAVSSDYDEVLPTVSNPPSPYRDVLKKNLWLMVGRGGGDLKQVRETLEKYVEYGMTQMYFVWHASFWSSRGGNGPEPFIGRMENSTGYDAIGGTESVLDFYRWLREQGFHVGYYEGYNFYQPICDFWDREWAAYAPDGNWRPTHVQSVRCKPWAFPELAATVSKARAEKWGANVVYMDGWTSNLPFESSDFDHRYSESGKMMDTIRAMSSGYRNMRQVLNGPVFSEGDGRHYRIAGLNDGNYGQTYDPARKRPTPLLVNFQLLKVHPLCADMGMGSYGMFAGNLGYDQLNEFVASEVAFGNMGMVEPYWNCGPSNSVFPVTLKTYFMVQQLQEQYIMEPVQEILYSDGVRMMDVSEAVANDVYLQSMVCVRYANGLVVYANCNPSGKTWTIEDSGRRFDLPKGGFYARGNEGLLAFSATMDGRRVDFSDGPNYTYVYPGAKPFADFNVEAPASTHWIRHKKGPRAGVVLTFVQK